MDNDYKNLENELKDIESKRTEIKNKMYEIVKNKNISDDAKEIYKILTSKSNGWKIDDIYDVDDDFNFDCISITLKNNHGFSSAKEIYDKMGYIIVEFGNDPTQFTFKKVTS